MTQVATLPRRSGVGTIRLQAVSMKQSGVRMFVGAAPAKDLIAITTVDYYNPDLPPTHAKQGYQRAPERSRITQIGRYLMEQGGSGLFPTAVLLSARWEVDHDPNKREITLQPGQLLRVVDGQHRIAGLRYAIQEKEATALLDFSVPFVVMQLPDEIVTEMHQFRIVNGTAKSVRTDLVNMIMTATVAIEGEHSIKASDRWKVVASRVVDRLDTDVDSPWHGLILMPGEAGSPKSKEPAKIVRATSFMTSLKPVYDWLTAFHFLDNCKGIEQEADKVYMIVVELWKALRHVVPAAFATPGDYVIQKTPGLFSLHNLLVILLTDMYAGRRKATAENYAEFLRESSEITDPRFWHKNEGRAAAYGSMKGFDDLFKLLRASVMPTTTDIL